MPTVQIPIANGFYQSESLPFSAQRCVNLYPNIPQAPSLSDASLIGSPGISQLATTGSAQQDNRGAHVKGGIAYFVNGTTLYRLDRTSGAGGDTFSTTALGTVSGSGAVSMADNGTQLMILVPGGNGYIYNEASGTPFVTISAPGFTANGAPQYVEFVDGYFVCTTDSKKFIISSLNDGTAWSALDFGSAESDPDDIVAPVVFRNQLFITGSETTEVFQNVPNGAGFPFQRANIFLDKGCLAPNSIVVANGTWMMIGAGVNESPAIWQYSGNSFQKVSTTAIDNVLSNATDSEISNASSWSYGQNGAYFVGFTFGNYTFVYDVISGRWHERSSFVSSADGRWRPSNIIKAYGRIVCGDYLDGRIGEIAIDEYMEYGAEIRRLFSTQPISANGRAMRMPQVELTIESGVGNADRRDPQVSMDLSEDGKIYKYERNRSMGKVGEYFRRAIWLRNGRFSRFVVLRFRISDPVKVTVIKLEAKIG